ncbi:MAG: hypothetical protein JST92_14535 [Deltaproteobacteria bacterium]|nr:hypothetical protein [Deltaproteobacteria bacterium]
MDTAFVSSTSPTLRHRPQAAVRAAAGLCAIAGVLWCSQRSEGIDLLRFPLAWGAMLLFFDALVRLRHGATPLHKVTDWAWACGASIAFWDLFELLNLRLNNWWYVGEVDNRLGSALFSAVSFATVLPAIRLGEAWLANHPPAHALERVARVLERPVARRKALRLYLGGLTSLALALAFPKTFFPLAWLWVLPLAEGTMLLLGPRPLGALPSPLEALREGDSGYVLRLLAYAIPLGLVWEGLNWGCARGWFYTVPWFTDPRVFEMPLPGYLGYPPFLLEAAAVLSLAGRVRLRVSARAGVLLIVAVLGFHTVVDGLGKLHTSVDKKPWVAPWQTVR